MKNNYLIFLFCGIAHGFCFASLDPDNIEGHEKIQLNYSLIPQLYHIDLFAFIKKDSVPSHNYVKKINIDDACMLILEKNLIKIPAVGGKKEYNNEISKETSKLVALCEHDSVRGISIREPVEGTTTVIGSYEKRSYFLEFWIKESVEQERQKCEKSIFFNNGLKIFFKDEFIVIHEEISKYS